MQDDWIVRPDGNLVVSSPDAFAACSRATPQAYKVEYEPDWSHYPKLAAVFEHRPLVNVYWDELQKLLVEARADAVQYVHDVRVDELRNAREDERERVKALLGVSDEDARLTADPIGVEVGVAKPAGH